MSWLYKSLNSSIGKKFVMAITGTFLILFLVIHLAGNFTLLGGQKAFNGYVETLDVVKPLIRIIEVVLAAAFILHIFNGLKLWLENKRARPEKYAVNASSKNSDIFSRTMVQTGSIVFIFLVLHLATFWYAFNFAGHPAPETGGYFGIVVDWFANPFYALFYVFAVILLGFHLNHGFQSAMQTFGWNNSRYFPLIEKIGTLYAIVMAIGFSIFPIYFLFFYGGN